MRAHLIATALMAALLAVVSPAAPASAEPLIAQSCDPNYWPCIPPPPPDLNCADVRQRVWVIGPTDGHHLDGDRDGIGCESYPIGPAGPPPGASPTTPPVGTPAPQPSCPGERTANPSIVPLVPSGSYTPVTPVRVADTRHAGGALAPGESRAFTVTTAQVPADAAMVAMNVTAVDPTAAGYLTVYPGGPVPDASNLNFTAGATVANFVMARVSDGRVVVHNSAGCTHVLLDIVGYVHANTGHGFHPLTPARVDDTRLGLGGHLGPLGAGEVQTLTVSGVGGVPVDATAVALNVTAVDPTEPGYVTVYPGDAPRPVASNLNLVAGTTIANAVIVKLDSAGRVNLFNFSGRTHLVVDVFGYYAPGGDVYVPVAPARLYEVRGDGAVGPAEQRDVQITGATVPATATAVAINVTAVDPTEAGFLTVWPSGEERPWASNVNLTAGTTVPGLAIVKLGSGGRLGIFNAAGRTGVIIDVAGYFVPSTSLLAPLTVSHTGAPIPYSRAAFGDDWIDEDGDCHNTRAEVLLAETTGPVTFNANGCTVATGRWTDPWSGFTSSSAADFQIDHLVPLANAWHSGAWAWSDAQRLAFAQNLADPDALVATHGPVNIAKSDLTPDRWRPPLASSWCRYAISWARVKHTWSLTVTNAELATLQQMATGC